MLSESNANLNEFEQPKGYPDAEFLLPLGGIGGQLGLKNKCIIVNSVPSDEVVIKWISGNCYSYDVNLPSFAKMLF